MMRGLKVQDISPDKALQVWKHSAGATAFTHPDFLEAVSDDVLWFSAVKGEETLCVWPVPIDRRGRAVNIPFTYYVGPLWSRTLTDLAPYRWFASSQEIYEAMISEVLSRFNSIRFEFSVGAPDLRAFSWWNYGVDGKPKFTFEPRYTAMVYGLQKKTNEDIANAFKKDERRSRIRRLLRNPPPLDKVIFERSSTIISLYEKTIARSGGVISTNAIETLEKIIEYVRNGNGEILCFSCKAESKIVAAQVMLDCGKVTNGIARCVSPDWLLKDASIWLTYNSLISARDRLLDTYDFNGANSPNRADDKHAFGAEYALFHSVNYSN